MRSLTPLMTTICVTPTVFATSVTESAPASTSALALLMPVLIVLALGVASLWWVRRRFGGALLPQGPLRVVQIVPVGPRERLLLLEHDGSRWFCGVTANSIQFQSVAADRDRGSARDIGASGPVPNPTNHSRDVNAV